MSDMYPPESEDNGSHPQEPETVPSTRPNGHVATAYVVQRSKSKGLAIALAVLLGPWTWLYTYEKDWWKFWVGMALDALAVVALLFLAPVGWIPVWIWAIVDVMLKRQHFYDHYRNLSE